MVSDNRSATLIREYLSSIHKHPDAPGRAMLENRLKGYVYWKRELAGDNQFKSTNKPAANNAETDTNPVSEAIRRKDAARADLASRRRRVRGGGATGAAVGRGVKGEDDAIPGQGVIATEADEIAEL
jgi:DNA excision repair protein ERCC-4